jgi:N-acetylglucosaminyldiphosphoundecaprenol N-acetyl-beta-D-mannosaminyltransferase
MASNASLFGVPVEAPALSVVLEELLKPQGSGPYWIVTANPEILLEAKRDPSYAEVLRNANVRMGDGFGLWAVLRLIGYRGVRVTGVDLALALLDHSERHKMTVGLIGRAAISARDQLRLRRPALKIVAEEGGQIGRDGVGDVAADEALHRMVLAAPDVLLVGFGHPKQERWILKNRKAFPRTRVMVGIGGTLDLWAGMVKRAPSWMRRMGLEWLWRLMMEPRRIRRILDAVVVFPVVFVVDRFSRRG